MKTIILFSVTCIFCFSLISADTTIYFGNTPKLSEIKKQHPKNIEFKADQLYLSGDYSGAYMHYLALKQLNTRQSAENIYRLGKTAVEYGHYATAKESFRKLLNKVKKYPQINFEYANVLKRMGDYQSAIAFYHQYIQDHLYEKNNEYLKLARINVRSCSKAMRTPLDANIGVSNLGSAALGFGKNVVALSQTTQNGIRYVEYRDQKGSCLKKVMPNMEIKEIKGIAGDPDFNVGSPYVARDGKTVYFTQNRPNAQGELEAKIYVGTIDAEGEIGEIRKLGSGINRVGFSSLSPTLAYTEYGQEILYFASTLPGGYGGYDIWYSVKMSNGKFTMAYNLGRRINSNDNEITPFYNQASKELYYSSNIPKGYGGYDVYKMTGNKKYWVGDEADHLAKPINSHGDDCYFILDNEGTGFFTSNRNSDKAENLKVYQFNEQMSAQSQNKKK